VPLSCMHKPSICVHYLHYGKVDENDFHNANFLGSQKTPGNNRIIAHGNVVVQVNA
jgi:hypothetical protein